MSRLATIALVGNAIVCALSLIGTFALLHNLTPEHAGNARLATLFGLLNILTAFVAAVACAALREGPRRTAILVAIAVTVAFLMELGGTTIGFPFGRYEYTDFLGPKLFGLVPWVLPFTWFTVAYPALAMAATLRPRGPLAPLVAGLLLTLADVPMDPAMNTGYASWRWIDGGAWYGMPLSNWLGWLGTGIGLWLIVRRVPGPVRPASIRTALVWYVQCAFMGGLAILYARPLAFWAWLAGAAPLALLLWRHHRRSAPAPRQLPESDLMVSGGAARPPLSP